MIARLIGTLVLFVTLGIVGARGAEQPNILLIMADDVGIEGLGCYGGASYQTPHLDSLAAEGLRFTHAFSQPLCTPTRVQIMTGKYNHRNWKYFGILDPGETTFGHRMKSAGYATGIFGKWQLTSYDPPDLPGATNRRGTGMHPKDAGFDRYSLFHALETEDKGSRYANPTMLEGNGGDDGTLKTYHGRYGEDVWVEKILGFFDDHRGTPTFAYYPMALPHWPFVPTPISDDWDPAAEQREDNELFPDMVQYLDEIVGRLVSGLRSRDLLENTIVLFYSDNGTHAKVVSEMQDGRRVVGGKATPRQTGIHVPLIAYWPDHVPPGTCNRIVDASDFVPTLLELAGAELPAAAGDDGISFAPWLFGKEGPEREAAFFWYDPRPGWDKERFGRHVFALNHDYKLFRTGRFYRLTDRPLEEIEISPLAMSAVDRQAKLQLQAVIDEAMQGVDEPPLVNAYGKPEPDLLKVPESREETVRVTRAMLEGAEEYVYGDVEVDQHRLWLFKPLDLEVGEQRPCVFFIHGGGWGGRPESLAAQCVAVQRLGYNAVTIHFRPPGDKRTPADTLRDARRAYRWLIANGERLQIDVERIVVSGGSAGGHLSLALSTIELPGDPVIEHPPRGFVLFNPVIDLVDGWSAGRKRCERSGIEPISFSPAHHVRSGLPPVLVLSGSKDVLIPPDLIRAFQERMRKAGNQCEFVEYPDATHAFFNYGRDENRSFQWTMWELEKFLQTAFH
ncbi:MAG: sulfatase-like hydrolase/transferase [Rubripirellula sp.]|nr:sulfatase-like hydrolase/transferase [Rubripirellula sp.]